MNKPNDKIVLKYEDFFSGNSEVEKLDNFLGLGGKLKNPADPTKRHQTSEEIPLDYQFIYQQMETAREKLNQAAPV